MEAILLSPNPDHQSTPRRSSKNRNYRGGFISRSSENFAPPSNIHGGSGGGGGILFGSPPSLYSSFPSSLSILGHHHQQQQPPLLPLPVPRIYSSLPAARNSKPILQFPPPPPPPPPNNRKNKNRTRDQDLTPKKSKSSICHVKPDSRSKIITKSGRETSTTLLISSTNRFGPEPRDIPKEVSGVLKPVVISSSATTNTTYMEGVEVKEEEELSVSGSIFSLAPPPSSLPLPKFSVTPRLRCNVEAGGIDVGATNNLRRLLHLQ